MKKIISFALGLTFALGAGAQTWQDALLFSENNYMGTARSVGMGNALTAIGGDPGSLVFNPAGSAVAGYSQFVITPGVTFSIAGSQASPAMESPLMGDRVNSTYARFKMPNVGFILNFDTGHRSGLKRHSFGVVFHSTNNYTGRFNAAGVNDDNSYAASLASSADGFSSQVLGSEDWFYSGDPARMPAWVDMTGYRAGLFNSVKDRDGAYVAVTEIVDGNGNFQLAAPLYQRYGQQTYGGKHDAVINYAFNFNDKFYIGANLGITTLHYSLSEYWSEAPQKVADFPAVQYSDGTSSRFESLRMNRAYRLSGSGVYFKLGALWRPVTGLRLAAAVQTPTMLNMTERYGYSAEVKMDGRYSGRASSAEDEWIYALRTPWIFNLGAAYTIGNIGLVSVDYELSNFSSARFRSRGSGGYAEGSFSDVNLDIRDILGVSHQVRVGAEVKVTPELSLRAGYNLITGAQRNNLDGNFNPIPLSTQDRLNQLKHSASIGVGYSFGHLYVDAAVRARFVPSEYVIPYNYYTVPDGSAFYNKVVDTNVLTPEVLIKTTYLDALLTLGWRF